MEYLAVHWTYYLILALILVGLLIVLKTLRARGQ